MKYETTPAFDGDFKRLSESEKKTFHRVVREEFVPAAGRFVQDRTRFPGSLRVRDIEGASGIFEMTWSFSGPDGRATFEWIEIEGERGIRWRRVGGHEIFRSP